MPKLTQHASDAAEAADVFSRAPLPDVAVDTDALPEPTLPWSIPKFGRLYGASRAMQQVFHMLERVAPSYVSVMIVGESGCGKELVAQTVHEMSHCADAPFVALNCGAMPATLVEAELFGYEKGAFTGAHRAHRGFFERARGGTLFLDEITEMPVDLQVRFLRVLETNRFTPVGGSKEIECNVRVLAATNRDPISAVRDNKLRQDLLYRLAVFPVVLPPLRERDEDVVLLARHFLHELNLQHGSDKVFAAGFEDKLHSHGWPGNVRELKNCIQRAYIMADNNKVSIDTLAPLQPGAAFTERSMMEFEIGTPLDEVEQKLIIATLDRYRGDKRRTARALGVSLKTIYNRLNAYSGERRNGTAAAPPVADAQRRGRADRRRPQAVAVVALDVAESLRRDEAGGTAALEPGRNLPRADFSG